MRVIRYAVLIAISVAAVVVNVAQTSAQTPEQFYKGKTVDLVIGYPPGGSNDTYGRLLARHFGRHIPGAPNVVPKNTPGAGSFVAVNQVFNVAPKDGTVVGIGAPTIAIDEKMGTQGVRFRTAELNWVGRINSLINIVFLWKTSPVKTIADAQRIEIDVVGDGRRLDRLDLPDRDEQRARHQVQADHGLSPDRTTPCWRWSVAKSKATRPRGLP